MKVWEFDDDGPSPLMEVPPPNWSGWEARYDNDLERGKRATRDVAAFPTLTSFFQDDAERWSLNIGIDGLLHDPTLHGGGVQVTSPGGYLNVHLDYDYHPVIPARRRALTLVAFLNAEWRQEWGGAIVFTDPSGNVIRRIYPHPRLVIAFEGSDLSYHGVEEVTGPASRITASKSLLRCCGRTRAMFLPRRI